MRAQAAHSIVDSFSWRAQRHCDRRRVDRAQCGEAGRYHPSKHDRSLKARWRLAWAGLRINRLCRRHLIGGIPPSQVHVITITRVKYPGLG
jgi:hypothetical protein